MKILNLPVLFASLFISAHFSSCSSSSKDDLWVIEALDSALISANQKLKRNNDLIIVSLGEKNLQYSTLQRAERWYPKAKKIHDFTATMFHSLEDLKEEIKKVTGFSNNNGNISFEYDNPEVIEGFFASEGRFDSLNHRLEKYRHNILHVDSIISQAFGETLPPLLFHFKLQSKFKTSEKHHKIRPVEALALLTRLQNMVLITENRMLVFCHENVRHNIEHYSSYAAIIAQSHDYIKAGSMLEIKAGVGYFSNSSMPKIIINGQIIPLDEYNTANYKFRIPNRIGKQFIPVKMEFTNEEGERQTISKNVEYTVE